MVTLVTFVIDRPIFLSMKVNPVKVQTYKKYFIFLAKKNSVTKLHTLVISFPFKYAVDFFSLKG